MRVLLLALLAAVPAAADSGPCDRAGAARLLGIPLTLWVVDCLPLHGDERLIAALPLPEPERDRARPSRAPAPLQLRIARAQSDRVLWRGELTVDPDAAPEVRQALGRAEDWFLAIERQPLGPTPGARIGVLTQWGSAVRVAREIALLVAVPPEPGAPASLRWVGPGNLRESRREVCVLDTAASFRLVDDQTLERGVKVIVSTGEGTSVPPARARALRKACVPPPPEPPRRYPLRGPT